MNAHVIGAIFRRNFISYFSTPTGYVFICVFTLLSGFAAFWPDEFWTSNLANLDQLNRWFPFIMLVFIPAITMSIWADEKRRGTDELLLTIPATDFDVICGKYLAAVSIYSVGLLFSLICNLIVLKGLGNPDVGQFLATYFGYWLVGLMMLAIGMVASFLTSDLTVAFVFGALFNVPLVFLVWADSIFANSQFAQTLHGWSVSEQFSDFGRGVISLSGLSYFLGITAAMLYLCMILIGRRHWLGGRDGHSMLGHYLLRAVALLGIAFGIHSFFSHHDAVRIDLSQHQYNSLSPETIKLIQEIDPKRPVVIDAFVSRSDETPESYVPTRLNLLTTLREFAAIGGSRLLINVHDVERFSDELDRAEQLYGIKPEKVLTKYRGVKDEKEVILGLAFTCGTNNAIVPFVGKSLPVEYEIVRTIATVSQEKRKKLGVITTDAQLFSGGGMPGGRNESIIEELQKQYAVSQVDPSQPITDKFDVLLCVQPSSLGPQQLENFINVVKTGVPTAIFEDPLPLVDGQVPGTAQPKRPPMNNPFAGMQPPQPKGDIQRLWDLLEVNFNGDSLVWQEFVPSSQWENILPKQIRDVCVFVSPQAGAADAFNPKTEITSKLSNVLFPTPGSIQSRNAATRTKFTPLIVTGPKAGVVPYNKVMQQSPFGGGGLNPRYLMERGKATGTEYNLAAHIESKASATVPTPAPKMSDKDYVGAEQASAVDKEENDKTDAAKGPSDDAKGEPFGKVIANGVTKTAPAPPQEEKLNVILVSDTDMLYSFFFNIRARAAEYLEDDLRPQMDNVVLALNIIDDLAGEQRFIEIRKRSPFYPPLSAIDDVKNDGKKKVSDRRDEENTKVEAEQKKAEAELRKKIEELRNRTDVDLQQRITEAQQAQENGQRRLDVNMEKLKQDREKAIRQIEKEQDTQIHAVQDTWKRWSVLLPPLLPLGIALFVFWQRRAAEREGVAASRLK